MSAFTYAALWSTFMTWCPSVASNATVASTDVSATVGDETSPLVVIEILWVLVWWWLLIQKWRRCAIMLSCGC
jgi:hypothetical protein